MFFFHLKKCSYFALRKLAPLMILPPPNGGRQTGFVFLPFELFSFPPLSFLDFSRMIPFSVEPLFLFFFYQGMEGSCWLLWLWRKDLPFLLRIVFSPPFSFFIQFTPPFSLVVLEKKTRSPFFSLFFLVFLSPNLGFFSFIFHN